MLIEIGPNLSGLLLGVILFILIGYVIYIIDRIR